MNIHAHDVIDPALEGLGGDGNGATALIDDTDAVPPSTKGISPPPAIGPARPRMRSTGQPRPVMPLGKAERQEITGRIAACMEAMPEAGSYFKKAMQRFSDVMSEADKRKVASYQAEVLAFVLPSVTDELAQADAGSSSGTGATQPTMAAEASRIAETNDQGATDGQQTSSVSGVTTSGLRSFSSPRSDRRGTHASLW
jgi:hypothetical protein